MSKAELVRVAENEAGLQHTVAMQEPAGQLRLLTQSVREQIGRSERELPPGLTRWNKPELIKECEKRSLDTCGTREKLILTLRQWSETSEHQGEIATMGQVSRYVQSQGYLAKKYSQPQLAPGPKAGPTPGPSTTLPVNNRATPKAAAPSSPAPAAWTLVSAGSPEPQRHSDDMEDDGVDSGASALQMQAMSGMQISLASGMTREQVVVQALTTEGLMNELGSIEKVCELVDWVQQQMQQQMLAATPPA